jgi:hypothetical protein
MTNKSKPLDTSSHFVTSTLANRFTVQETDHIRVVQYPDGTQKIQRERRIFDHETTYPEWYDLPVIQVDEDGQEIQ